MCDQNPIFYYKSGHETTQDREFEGILSKLKEDLD